MTVADDAVTMGDDRPTDDVDESTSTGTRRRADRTGVADRPRENRSPAAQRAIDRRRKRAAQRSTATIAGRRHVDEGFLARITRSPGEAIRRVPFVVLVIGILSVGLGLTLWLSTTSAQDSYQLSVQRQSNQDLTNRLDALKKTFELGNSAPEIADKATKQGMIPAKDVARLVVGTDGKTRVIGEITPATGSPAPSMDSGSTRNSVAPQSASAAEEAARAAAAQTAPGVDLSGGSTDAGSGPIAANVLPQSPSAAPAPSVATPQAGAQTSAAQQPR